MQISNYDKMKNNMASTFLQYDQEKMIQKFLLEYDETYLYIFFVARNYRINRLTGKVEWTINSFKTVHEAGRLTFQGTRYLSFER